MQTVPVDLLLAQHEVCTANSYRLKSYPKSHSILLRELFKSFVCSVLDVIFLVQVDLLGPMGWSDLINVDTRELKLTPEPPHCVGHQEKFGVFKNLIKINITNKTTKETLEYFVSNRETIGDLKNKIKLEPNLKMSYKGLDELKDEQTLREAGMLHGCVVYLEEKGGSSSFGGGMQVLLKKYDLLKNYGPLFESPKGGGVGGLTVQNS